MSRGGRELLRGVSFCVPSGATCAVVGANGAGKSTLLRVLEGWEYPTAGRVRVLGETLGETNLAELRKRVRLVGSAGGFAGGGAGRGGVGEARDFSREADLLTIVAAGSKGMLVHYGELEEWEKAEAMRALRGVGLGARVGVKWGHASAGERVRTMLACVRVRPREMRGTGGGGMLTLLDEPTAGLDPGARAKAVRALARPPRGVTQMIVTHHIEELPGTTSLALVLKGGRAAAFGEARKVLTSGVLSEAFGVRMRVRYERGSEWPWSAGVEGG